MDRITKAALIGLVVVVVGMAGFALWPVQARGDSCGPAVAQAFRQVDDPQRLDLVDIRERAEAIQANPLGTETRQSVLTEDIIENAQNAKDRACRDAGRSRMTRTVGIGVGLSVVIGSAWWIARR